MINFKKHFFLFIITPLFAINSYGADSIVYKCTDSSGHISYVNNLKKEKELKCKKTDLGHVDKSLTVNKESNKDSPLELIVPGINKPPLGLPKDNKISIDQNVELIQKPSEIEDSKNKSK